MPGLFSSAIASLTGQLIIALANAVVLIVAVIVASLVSDRDRRQDGHHQFIDHPDDAWWYFPSKDDDQ